MIPLPHPIKLVSQDGNKGVFEIEGLYPGYGVTIGHSLRRILLTSLEGASVTEVKIKGVPHEFSTMPGVMEDVLTILMNLKQMRFAIHGDEPLKGELKIKGEKEVTGADFKLSSQLTLANPAIKIATLTDKKAELDMEITVERGIGYVPSEARRKTKEEIGVIALDAIFTPVRNVSHRVDHMRVGDRTDFDRVTLIVETDGTISPSVALAQAGSILRDQVAFIVSGLEAEEKPAEEKKVAKKAATKTTETAEKKVEKKTTKAVKKK
ncbi:MAG: DNA-directed RNA polymerase subunit alpha [bacterium]|nr:DNA-directed RNA polymerase subunit alpha [bacterium]